MVGLILFMIFSGQAEPPQPSGTVVSREILMRRTEELLIWYRFWYGVGSNSTGQAEETIPVVFAVMTSGKRVAVLVPKYGLQFNFRVIGSGRDDVVQVLRWDPVKDSATALQRLYEVERRDKLLMEKADRFTQPRPDREEFIVSSDSALISSEVLHLGSPEPPPAKVVDPQRSAALLQAIMLNALLVRSACGPMTFVVPRFRHSDPEIRVAVQYEASACANGIIRFRRVSERQWDWDKTIRTYEGEWSGVMLRKVLENTLLTIKVP